MSRKVRKIGVFRGTDTWTITGGTGRFEDAEGSGGGTTIVDLNEGTFTKKLEGTIFDVDDGDDDD